MNSICAIIDAQGFVVDDEFHVRELAIAPIKPEVIQSWDVDMPFEYHELSVDDCITAMHISRFHTGLPFKPLSLSIPSEKLDVFLYILYEKCKKDDMLFFGIKNNQFGVYLDKIGIPYVKIKSPCIHKLKSLYSLENQCKRHFFKENGVCAEQKVDLLRQWFIDSKLFSLLIDF